jgi:hypothetical protein
MVGVGAERRRCQQGHRSRWLRRLRPLASGYDPDASEGTKGSIAFPYGDFSTVNRAALIHAKQRASQNGHEEIEKAADDLLQHLDTKRS